MQHIPSYTKMRLTKHIKMLRKHENRWQRLIGDDIEMLMQQHDELCRDNDALCKEGVRLLKERKRLLNG